jgi:hypothetical protein
VDCRSDAHELEEESGPLSSQASTASSHADILAGEPSAEKVDGFEIGRVNCRDIAVASDIGPPPFQDARAVLVDLNLPTTFPTRQFEATI